jgi:hypothetical protein
VAVLTGSGRFFWLPFGFFTFLFQASGRLMMLGRADLVFRIAFPNSENNFEAGFSGFKVDGFLRASPEKKNYQLLPSKSRPSNNFLTPGRKSSRLSWPLPTATSLSVQLFSWSQKRVF